MRDLINFMFALSALTIVGLMVYWLFFRKKEDTKVTQMEATTIRQSIENISKLMVTEGHYSEVYTFKEEDRIFFNLIPTEKKALIVLNAKVQVGYDLNKIVFDINQAKKTVTIESIPEPEINIYPDVKYYDVQSSSLSNFNSEDMNKVQAEAMKVMREKIEESDLKERSKIRLKENLLSIVNVSNAFGWKIEDKTHILEASQPKKLNP